MSESKKVIQKECILRNKCFVQEEFWKKLLIRIHREDTGHLKQAKLFNFIKERFYWPKIVADIKRVMQECNVCARLSKAKGYCLLQPIQAVYPFQFVSMDTGYVTWKNNHGEPCYEYFVVAVDHLQNGSRSGQ